MNETQQKLYELLLKFDGLCRKFGITYYLGGGCALGALRHKGFLPWDDDVDLYISRDNYEKLLSVQDKFFNDEFVLVNTANFPRYRNTLVRCVDTNTTAITKARIVDESPKGQFVELFIMDPIPKNKKKQAEWFTKQWIYCELLSVAFCVANDRIAKNVDEELYNEYKKRAEEVGYDEVLSELESELFTIKESDADEYCSRWGLRNLIYNIEWFGKPRYVQFEDAMLPVPEYAENVSRFDYGDNWMYIPSVGEQRTHSINDSMHIPYKYFVEDYLNFIDKENVYQKYYARKDNLVNQYLLAHRSMNLKNQIKKDEVLLSIEHNKNTKIEQALNKKDLKFINDYFQTWYENQFNTKMIQYGCFIPIDDDLLYIALIPVILRGDYSLVRKLLLLRLNEGKFSKKIQLLYNFVDLLRETYIAIDYHNHKLAKKLLVQIKNLQFDFCDEQFNYRILSLKYEIDDINKSKNYEDVLSRLIEFLNENKTNGEIMYLVASLYYNIENYDEATKWFKKSLANTNHGFVIMDINNKLNILNEKGGDSK